MEVLALNCEGSGSGLGSALTPNCEGSGSGSASASAPNCEGSASAYTIISASASTRAADSLRALNARLMADLSSARRACAVAEEAALTSGVREKTATSIATRLIDENKQISSDARRALDEEAARRGEAHSRLEASLCGVDARIAAVSTESARTSADNTAMRGEVCALLEERERLQKRSEALEHTMSLENRLCAAVAAEAEARVAAAEAQTRVARAGEASARADVERLTPAIAELTASYKKTLKAHGVEADRVYAIALSKLSAEGEAKLIKSMTEQTVTLKSLTTATARANGLAGVCAALQGERDALREKLFTLEKERDNLTERLAKLAVKRDGLTERAERDGLTERAALD